MHWAVILHVRGRNRGMSLEQRNPNDPTPTRDELRALRDLAAATGRRVCGEAVEF